MKFAYLILVHKNPKQLARLVSRLNTKDALVFIHIDKKVSEEVFEKEIRKLHIKNIHFVKDRKSIVWGGFNMVKAMISGLKELAASEEEISHVTLLSGQDYPIKPIEEYHQFLLQHQNKTFVQYNVMPHLGIPHGGLDRIGYRHIIFPRKLHLAFPLLSFLQVRSAHAEKGKLFIIKKIVHILPKARPYPRKFLTGMTPYCGSQWSVFSMAAVRYVIDFSGQNKQFYDFFKYTHIPDEMFFQSILLNAEEKVRKNVENRSLQYVNWREPRREHPENIGLGDLDKMLKSERFIARKFEAEQDTAVLDKLDEIHALSK